MAQAPIDGTLIVHELQSNWPNNDTNGSYRQWYSDGISVFIANIIMPDDAHNDELDGWVGMGTNQYQAALDAFKMWDELLGISVSLTTDNEDADVTFAYSTTTNSDGTYASAETGDLVGEFGYGSYEIEDEDIWMSADGGWPELTEALIGMVGGRGFMTFMHEIGHALGLSHTGQYNASDSTPPDYSEDAEFPQDTGEYSIMSYFGDAYDVGFGWTPPDDDTPHTPVGSYIYWQTPTMYDIAAAQSKYGVEMTTRAGDTTYGYNASGVGVWAKIYDFALNATPLLTIWDGGGIDTIDTSGYTGSTAQVIDLTAGSYSDVNGLIDNLAIAYGVTIENAIGGASNDLIKGNGSANILSGNGGNDTIYGYNGIDSISGGSGDDFLDAGGSGQGVGIETLSGGSGDDTFVYSRGYRYSVVSDFNVTTEGDRLDISKQTIHNFTDLMAAAVQVGADTVIDFGNATTGVSDKLTLLNFNVDDLDAGQFKFSESEISAPGDFTAIANPGLQNFYTFYSTGAALADGFMMVETSIATYNGSQALMAHRYDERGVETGTFQINTTGFGQSGLSAKAATLGNGNVVVIWVSFDTGGGGDFCFRGRVFNEHGVAVGNSDFVVNATPPVAQNDPNGLSMNFDDLLVSSSGAGFTVRWRKDVTPGSDSYQVHVYERGFDNNGTPVTGDIDLGAYGMPNVPIIPDVNGFHSMALSNGTAVQWWTGYVPGDSSGTLKIMARISDEEAYVVVGDNNLSQPVSVDELADGNVVFNWSQGSIIGGFTPYMPGARVLILDEDLRGFVRPGTVGDETLTGGIYNDELYGLGGNDKLVGGRGADVLDGGEGFDTVDYSGSIEGVEIDLSSLLSQSNGHAQGDKLVSIENVIGSGAGDIIRDSDADNYLYGSYGGDRFYVRGGNDTVDGGRGNDIVIYGGDIDDYNVTYDAPNARFTIADARSASPDGTDRISGVERFAFAGEVYTLAQLLDHIDYHEDHPVTANYEEYFGTAGDPVVQNAAMGLLANDIIPDGGGAVVGVLFNGQYVMSFDDPFYGTFSVAADGSFSFLAPAAGIYTFNYRIKDADGSTGDTWVNFYANPEAPDAMDDAYSVKTGTTLTISAANGLLANDDPVGGTASVVGLVDGDQLVYSLDADGGMLEVSSDGSFLFTSDANFTGTVSFEYSITGNSSVTDTATVVFTVANGNTAPMGADKTITIDEDKGYKLLKADFGFSDADDKFSAVMVDSIFGSGVLKLGTKAVEAGDTVDVSDLGKLVWTPSKNASGDEVGGIEFRVVDDGGTDDGGHDTDLISNFITFDVNEITDFFKGKKGKDTFVGTDDHDVFDGKQGNDTFTGNGGTDTFVFKTAYDKDTIIDFQVSSELHDIVDLRGLKSIKDYDDLFDKHLKDHGDDVWIIGGKGDTLVLKNVDFASLAEEHFII